MNKINPQKLANVQPLLPILADFQGRQNSLNLWSEK